LKVLFAGTPGVGKRVALENLLHAIQTSFPRERPVFTVREPDGTSRVPVLDHFLYGQHPLTFLQLAQESQRQKWREEFARLRSQFRTAPTDHHFLGVHLTFRFEQIPSCVVSFKDLIDWKPDCIVTFIDDVYCVRARIHKGEYTAFTLPELTLWRAEEILVGDLLAQVINPISPPPNYVVAVKHPAEMLARLLMQPQTARIYISHVISEARKDDRSREVIDEFRKRLRKQQNCAVFEPLTIDELPPLLSIPRTSGLRGNFRYDASNPKHRWPFLDPTGALANDEDLRPRYPLLIPYHELKDARRAIEAQITRRDIRLVDQSHCLIIYRPTLTGDRILSAGVHAEMSHALDTGRRIIWYLKKGEDPPLGSPFLPKSTGDNPDFIYERDEGKLWARIAEVNHKGLDNFLR
jgi:hypothetical protein